MDTGSESDSDQMDLDLDEDPTPLPLGRIGGEKPPSTTRKKGSCNKTKTRWMCELKTKSQDLAENFPGTQVMLFIHHTTPITRETKFFGKAYGAKAHKFLTGTQLGKEIRSKIKLTAQTWSIQNDGNPQETVEHEVEEEEEESPDDVDIAMGDGSQLPKVSAAASKIVAEGLAKSRESKARKDERLAILEARRRQQNVSERRGKKSSAKNTASRAQKATVSGAPVVFNKAVANSVQIPSPMLENVNNQPIITSSAHPVNTGGPFQVTPMSLTKTNSVTVENSTEVPATASPVFGGTVCKSNKLQTPSLKLKCYNLLSKILSLSRKQPGSVVATNIQALIQSLIDGEIEVEEFYTNLQKELGPFKQDNPIPLLKKTLPELRHSLAKRELKLEGIIPPNIPPEFPVSSIGPVKVTTMRPTNTNSVTVGSSSPDILATASPAFGGSVVVSTLCPTNNNSVTVESSSAVASATTSPVSKGADGNSDQTLPKFKCYNFLSKMISLSKEKTGSTADNVLALIQQLIDATYSPEEFFSKLQIELGRFNPGQIIPFLTKSLPDLRNSLATKEIILDGVVPPTFSLLKKADNQQKITSSGDLVDATVPVKVTTMSSTNTNSVTYGTSYVKISATASPGSSGAVSKSDQAPSPKLKCYSFLSKILSLSRKQPGSVLATNILIQSLIDGESEVEEFCTNLQKEFGSFELGNTIPFLKNSLPELRYSLAKRELELEGIIPPNIPPDFPVNSSGPSRVTTMSPTNTNSVTVESSAEVSVTAIPVSSGAVLNSDQSSLPKLRCYNFLSKILSLPRKELGSARATSIQVLIQSLIDGKVGAEEFYTNLQKELGTIKLGNPIPLLKNTLPELRYSLAKRELKLEGIIPPSIPPYFPVNLPSSTNQINSICKKSDVQQQAIRRPLINLINTASPNVHQSAPFNFQPK